jgi:hypothetical protein
MAAPIPLPPPVTIATFPMNRFIFLPFFLRFRWDSCRALF